jgi:DNA-binding beta-propeller fold protein YncE
MTAGASYTGLAINHAQNQLYAANNVVGGGIDVFNSSFGFVTTIATPSAISSRNLVPFNVQDINGMLYVTCAAGAHSRNYGRRWRRRGSNLQRGGGPAIDSD